MTRKGWTDDTLQRLGVTLGADGRWRLGNVAYSDNGHTPKMLAPAGVARDLWPAPESIEGEELFVVEGEPDAVSMAEMSLPAVGYPGTGKWDAAWADRLAEGRERVIVVGDCDTLGRRKARDVAQRVAAAGALAFLVDLDPGRDDGYDVGDLLVDLGATTARSFLDELTRERVGPGGVGLQQDAPATAIELVEARGRTPRTVEWLWQQRVPLEALTGLAGVPDAGKSTFACHLVSEVSNGTLPGALQGTPRRVLIASLEDTIDRVLIPRLLAAGADLDNVAFVRCRPEIANGVIDLTQHLPQIENLARTSEAALIVIDPLVAALGTGGKLDSHKDQQVRSVLAPTALMAERLRLAVLGVMHFSKAAVDALLGVGGSIGFVGAPRSVLVLVSKPDDAEGHRSPHRILGHSKSNWGPKQRSREVTIVGEQLAGYGEQTIETSRVILGDEVDLDPSDLLASRSSGRPRNDEVRRAIPALLGVTGPLMREKICIALGRTLKDGTVFRALKELVDDGTLGVAGSDPAIYSLPGSGSKTPRGVLEPDEIPPTEPSLEVPKLGAESFGTSDDDYAERHRKRQAEGLFGLGPTPSRNAIYDDKEKGT